MQFMKTVAGWLSGLGGQRPTRVPSARDRLAAAIWRASGGTSRGATKAEVLSVVRQHDRGPDGRPMARTTFLQAWADLDAAGLIGMSGGRYVLSRIEAERLGLLG